MRIGLLWYDADRKKSLEQKIDEALYRYADKFGTRPNACHVNPQQAGAHPRLRVIPNRLIQPDHFWLGEEEQKQY